MIYQDSVEISLDRLNEKHYLPMLTALKDTGDKNCEYLLNLLDVNTSSIFWGKTVIFLDLVLSNTDLTDKFIAAIQNYNDREALRMLDG